jgi:hypothetical protein
LITWYTSHSFLKAYQKNPQLEQVFEDDIKELFGLRGRPFNEEHDKYNPYVFSRLIESALTWNEKNDGNKAESKNFKLILIHILQHNISKNKLLSFKRDL